jgi:hypothetical protein
MEGTKSLNVVLANALIFVTQRHAGIDGACARTEKLAPTK